MVEYIKHSSLGPDDMHPPHKWVYNNESERLAASGFVAGDVGQIAWQKSDSTKWTLEFHSPATWSQDGIKDHSKLSNVGTLSHAQIDAHIASSEASIAQINTDLSGKVSASEKGQPGGIATLNGSGFLPVSQTDPMQTPTHKVADITARDLLVPGIGWRAHVDDASADPTVNAGYAGYMWDGTEWKKQYEEEGLDLDMTVEWADVQSKPASYPDADKLIGKLPSTIATALTIAQRDSDGDLFARLFRSTFASTSIQPGAVSIPFRGNDTDDNYIRFMTPATFKAWLGALGIRTTDEPLNVVGQSSGRTITTVEMQKNPTYFCAAGANTFTLEPGQLNCSLKIVSRDAGPLRVNASSPNRFVFPDGSTGAAAGYIKSVVPWNEINIMWNHYDGVWFVSPTKAMTFDE